MPSLHVTNGSHAGDKLATFVNGPVRIAADVLHEGPAPRVDDEAWYDLRARFLCAGGACDVDAVRADLAEADQTIRDALARDDDVVLWFEHDLFDQLALIRTLDLLVRTKPDAADGAAGCSLICIDRFPGVQRFIGLGQLDAAQLATLWPSRLPVTREQFALAASAWEAFRAPDPTALLTICDAARALPFLADALGRFFAEYPSIHNGLTRSEELALGALADGPLDGGVLFGAAQAPEARPFMGDITFFRVLRGLAGAVVPLVTIEAAPDELDLRARTIAITDAGRDVLAARTDRVALNGIDLWRGGVHLSGTDRSPWRWDARRKTLVS